MSTKQYSSIKLLKETIGHLSCTKSKLGFHSIEELINTFLKIQLKTKWSKLDLECLGEYGEIPDIGVSTPEELREKGYRRVAQFEQKLDTEIKVNVVKPRIAKKKQEEPQYFQGIEKPKTEE